MPHIFSYVVLCPPQNTVTLRWYPLHRLNHSPEVGELTGIITQPRIGGECVSVWFQSSSSFSHVKSLENSECRDFRLNFPPVRTGIQNKKLFWSTWRPSLSIFTKSHPWCTGLPSLPGKCNLLFGRSPVSAGFRTLQWGCRVKGQNEVNRKGSIAFDYFPFIIFWNLEPSSLFSPQAILGFHSTMLNICSNKIFRDRKQKADYNKKWHFIPSTVSSKEIDS